MVIFFLELLDFYELRFRLFVLPLLDLRDVLLNFILYGSKFLTFSLYSVVNDLATRSKCRSHLLQVLVKLGVVLCSNRLLRLRIVFTFINTILGSLGKVNVFMTCIFEFSILLLVGQNFELLIVKLFVFLLDLHLQFPDDFIQFVALISIALLISRLSLFSCLLS